MNKKNLTAAAAAEDRKPTNAEAAALGLDSSERYTYYFFEKKGKRK